MAPETQPQDSNVDYVKLLEDELKSCCMPAIRDPHNASTDDLLRDLYRILTGNGAPTHGMIFKMAAANVNIRLLKDDVFHVEQKLEAQAKTCQEFRVQYAQDEAAEEAEKATIAKVGRAIWKHKGLIFMIILAALVYFNSLLTRHQEAQAAAAVEKRIQLMVEKKIEQIFLGRVRPAPEAKTVDKDSK